jgi:hypothetical protein
MNCTRCRRRIPDGSVFCPSCGSQVPGATAATGKKGGVPIFATIVLFLGAIGIGAGGAYGFATLHPNKGSVAQAAVHPPAHHRAARKHN